MEIDDRYTFIDQKVLIPQLTVKDHLDIIHTKENVGMHGGFKDIQIHLLKFYENGINWDESQSFFPLM